MRTLWIVSGLVTAALLTGAQGHADEIRDPLDRAVTKEALSADYQQQSDARSNIEYEITQPVGTATDAVGTRFQRSDTSFEIVNLKVKEDVYDDSRSDTFPRVIYQARELIPGPLQPRGREILVTVDYKAVRPPDDFYRAYIAEVRQGICVGCDTVPSERKIDTKRWEFRKVGSRP